MRWYCVVVAVVVIIVIVIAVVATFVIVVAIVVRFVIVILVIVVGIAIVVVIDGVVVIVFVPLFSCDVQLIGNRACLHLLRDVMHLLASGILIVPLLGNVVQLIVNEACYTRRTRYFDTSVVVLHAVTTELGATTKWQVSRGICSQGRNPRLW